jgi:hypothetical protein
MIDMMEAVVAASRRRFNPLSLSPALWLDFSDSTTLFNATSGGSLPGDGVGIARVEDKSGHGRNFTQSSSSARPTRQTGVQNGLAVARFDGSDDFLSLASGLDILKNVSGSSIFAAYRWISNPTVGSTVVHIATSSTGLGRHGIGGGISSRKIFAGGRRLDADSSQTVSSTADNPTTTFIHSSVVNNSSTTITQRLNATTDGNSSSFQTSGSTSNTDSAEMTLGRNQGSANFCNIDLSELFVFNRAISDSERNALHNYLASKWGITLA